MKNNDFIPSLRDESQDLPKQSKDSPSLAEGDTGGGLKAQNNSGVKFSNDKSTHPLTPSAREGVDLGLPSVRERGQVGKSHNDDKNYKRFAVCFVWSLLVATFISIAFVALLYIYDPLQIYHKPYFREIIFTVDSRIQIKGVLKNYDFDSFVWGTSMMENTLSKEAEQKLGGKWVNISSGSFALNERAVILKYIFKHKQPKHFIFSLDVTHLVVTHTNDTKNYAFLYDDNEINDFKIYLNKKTISCAFRFSTSENCIGKKSLGNLISYTWGIDNEYKWRVRFGGIKQWLRYTYEFDNNANFNGGDLDIKDMKRMATALAYNPKSFTETIESNQQYVEENLLTFARANPNTKFSIVIPTYSRLFYRLNSEIFPKEKVILKWLVNEVANMENVAIYGFDDLPYADDIANYKDLTHYNIDMNSMQLDAIANGTHILTPQNIDTYLATMESKIKNYDITPLIAEIKQWEAKQM